MYRISFRDIWFRRFLALTGRIYRLQTCPSSLNYHLLKFSKLAPIPLLVPYMAGSFTSNLMGFAFRTNRETRDSSNGRIGLQKTKPLDEDDDVVVIENSKTKEEDLKEDESDHNKERYTFEDDDDDDGEFDDLD
ncbi:hypothetical protein Tco_0967417 [Tanacetum coccineum]